MNTAAPEEGSRGVAARAARDAREDSPLGFRRRLRHRSRRGLVVGLIVFAAGAGLPATARAAQTVDQWREALRQTRKLAENDVPRACADAQRLQADPPAGATAADRILALNVLARTELYAAQTEAAGKHAQQARELARQQGDRVGEAEAELTLALNTVNQGVLEPLIELTTRSVAVLEGVNRPDLLGEALLRAGMMYRRFGKIDESTAMCLHAMEIAQGANDPLALVYAHQGLGVTYDQSDHKDQAREHYQQMLHCARLAHSRLLEADAISSLAGVATSLGDLRGAEAQYREAIALYRAAGAPFSLNFGLIGLARNLRLQGRQTESLAVLDEVLATYNRYQNRLGIWFTLNWRSEAHLSLGDTAAALEETERAYALAREINFPLYISESARRIAAIAATRGDHQRAYELERTANEMTAKAAQESISARVMEITRRYEIESRQRELEDLRRRNEQQGVELRQHALERRWLWTLLLGSTVVLAIGLYFLIRLRRSQQLIEASHAQLLRSQEELRQRNRELTLVNRIIAAATSEQDVSTILNIACHELALAFDVPRAGVALLSEDRASAAIVAEYVAGGGDSALNVSVSLIGNPLFQILAVEKHPLIAEDAVSDPRLESERELLRRLGVKSQLIWPLFVENQAVGALILSTSQRRTFTADEARLASTISDELSDALDQARLTEAHRRLTTAIEQSPESVMITDAQARIVYVNPAFERLTGYSRAEALGQNPRLLKSGRQDATVYRELWATITAGEAWHGRLVNKRKDGSLFTEDAVIAPVRDASGAVVNFVGIKRDVTRELQLEERFLQAQKMEAFGQLAGGVAHDFNNILAATLMLLNLIQLEPDLSARVRSSLKELEDEARRAAGLTRQLLMFSRRQAVQKQPLDLNQVVKGLLKMLRRILGEDIKLVLLGDDEPLSVEADAGMMEQVIMNLCVNARDAMPHGGQLTIGTRLVARDEVAAAANPAKAGCFACLTVADTGCGMDPATLKRIFEPFYTTKAVGHGTGLGLATVHGIVERHRGWVEVESTVGRGSTFRVFLPAIERHDSTAAEIEAADLPRGTEAILLVEDEAPVRELAAMSLQHHGYRVTAVANGVEALLKWDEHEHEFDLLLTDMIMPEGISGLALAEQLVRAKDTLKVVIASGYSADLRQPVLPAGKKFVFLSKPFGVPALLQVVRQCLDAGATDATHP